MPGKRITELTAITGAETAGDDDLLIFDTNANETKRISRSQLAEGMQADLVFGAVFRVIDYIDSTAYIEAIYTHDESSQDASANTTAIRAAFDAALAFMQGGAGRGALVEFPIGEIIVDDELFSDSFQSAWWSQTSLGKGKFLSIYGAGSGVSFVKIASTYVGSCRNSANSNQRTYGPWADEPSPSILFPIVANVSAATPAAVSMRGLYLRGTGNPGGDPIPLMTFGELDASFTDLYVVGFANWGEYICGSFNGVRRDNAWEGCGLQPTEVGAVLGFDAGFVTPRVNFTYTASTNTIEAFAGSAFGAYVEDDPVPYFNSDQEGKTFVLHQCGNFGGTAQPLTVTIDTVAGDNLSTTVTVDGSVTDQNGSNKAGSFLPVQATTTAASAQITLSAPVKIGDGAVDMVGHIVAIPKGVSTTNGDLDLFVSRIISCDTGSDANGYTVVTLADAPAASVTEDIIFGASHAVVQDETSLAAGQTWSMDDTDFIACRYVCAGGFGSDVRTGAYIMVTQNAGESVQYVSCKFHGANPTRSNFAQEGQSIIDNADGIHLVGCDFTHQGLRGGSVRLIGASGRVTSTASALGGWQLGYDWAAWLIDPQSGYSTSDWQFNEIGTIIKASTFPNYTQREVKAQAGLSDTNLNLITEARLTSLRVGRDAGGTYDGNINIRYDDRFPKVDFVSGSTVKSRIQCDVNNGYTVFDTANTISFRDDVGGSINMNFLADGSMEFVKGVTVANLDASPTVGQIARVTDANTPSVGSTVAGSGAAAALVWYNGSNWTVIGV